MNKIEVAVLDEASNNPAGMQLFLAKLTQRGHVIQDMATLQEEYNRCVSCKRTTQSIMEMSAMPHGTIKRFTPITIAVVGASRRFLAQARTNQVGFNYVSASLQYSDYSNNNSEQFVVPYEISAEDYKNHNNLIRDEYLDLCANSLNAYQGLVKHVGNDAAGYAMPQGLRNILIIQGNHQSWDYLIRLRTCNRNTLETQYVALKIWDALLNTMDGDSLFNMSGPDCFGGKCREGAMSCGMPFITGDDTSGIGEYLLHHNCTVPAAIIATRFNLL